MQQDKYILRTLADELDSLQQLERTVIAQVSDRVLQPVRLYCFRCVAPAQYGLQDMIAVQHEAVAIIGGAHGQ